MGTPAEHRSLLAHLINVRTPYSYETPRFVLMCEGITELTEELEPDPEDIQYICEKTKTTNVKSYSKKLEVDMTYVKDNEIINYANYLLRTMPVGQKAAGDYVRLNKDELMYSTADSYIAIRQRATVYPESIGGSAEDPLHSKFSMGSAGDQVVGYITINNSSGYTTYSWTQANLEVPYVTKIGDISIEDFYKNMTIQADADDHTKITFKLQGINGSTIKLYKGVGQEVSIESIPTWDGNECTFKVACSSLFGNDTDTSKKVTLSFQQIKGAESSITTHPLIFNLIKGELPTPIISTPTEGKVTRDSYIVFSGTAHEFAKVELTNPDISGSTIEVLADANGRFSANMPLVDNKENSINYKQTVNTQVSDVTTRKVNRLGTPTITTSTDDQVASQFNLQGTGLKGATITLFKDGVRVNLNNTSDADKVNSQGEFTITPSSPLTTGKYKFTVVQSLGGITSPVSNEVEITITTNEHEEVLEAP